MKLEKHGFVDRNSAWNLRADRFFGRKNVPPCLFRLPANFLFTLKDSGTCKRRIGKRLNQDILFIESILKASICLLNDFRTKVTYEALPPEHIMFLAITNNNIMCSGGRAS